MNISDFITKLKLDPISIQFSECIAIIDQHYSFNSYAFSNGNQHNEAGQNNGSCKILAFAQLQQLDEQLTLHCFGDYYRIDVLKNPEANDHQNIRQFMQHGWEGIRFGQNALIAKTGD